MQIELVANPNITVQPGQQGKGSWKKMEVLYRNEGKVQTKNLVSFKNPTVFKVFTEAKQGQVFEVESVKGEPNAEGKQFWEWKSAHLVGQGETPVVDTAGTPAKPVTKMVVTEADRNRYIVRQSSLERALEYTLAQNTSAPLDLVLSYAGAFEQWVFRPVDLSLAKGSPVGEAPVAANSTVEAPRKRGRPAKFVAAPAGTENLDIDSELEEIVR